MINANKLKAKLVEEGKNVEWLAGKLGYTASNLYNKLNGNSSMTLEDANKIRKELNFDDEIIIEIFFNN